jgi:all-trans-8'-apo-beta-carotenal 15,15'-oxygenase
MKPAIASRPAPSPAPAPADPELFSMLWSKDLAREHGFEPLAIEGKLPASLRGTLYRNGPGLFGGAGARYSHPFEADGAVTAIRLEGGHATGASKVHASTGLVEERARGKLLYGLSAPWWRRFTNGVRGKGKNTANTNIVAWQGRLFALMEAAKPTEIDPRDLSTIGETDLGVIGSASFFSAHPHRVASRKALYNFGLEYGRKTKLNLFELPDVGAPRQLGSVELPAPPMVHDFIATDTHLVFFISPARVNVPRMLLALGSFDQLFQWKPEAGTEILCVPIDRPDQPIRFTTDSFYQWHFANAFDRGNTLVVDYVRYANFNSFYQFGDQLTGAAPLDADGTFHRAIVDLTARTFRTEQRHERLAEFPTIRPGVEGREHDVTYAAFDQLGAIGAIDARGKVVAHELPGDQRASEPLFVDGHVLALCHTRDRAFVAVYDAARIPEGPVARIWLDHHVPITFHGTFVPTIA